MGKQNLTLALGGAKSGKSEFAESLHLRQEKVCYIVAGVVKSPDGEIQLRIKRHQECRSANWTMREQYRDATEAIEDNPLNDYLLDDAIMLVTNLFYDFVLTKTAPERIDAYLEQTSLTEIAKIRQMILDEWTKILMAQKQNSQSMVIVSDEVGLGVVPATKQTRILCDLYGEVNQLIAKKTDNVYFVISGLVQKIK